MAKLRLMLRLYVHVVDIANWQTACETLGIDQAGFVERIRSSSSVRPQSSIASLILLAASLPPLQQQAEKAFSPPSTTLEDAMPVLSICLNGSAVDAGTALAWSLVEKAKTGACAVEFDQVTFLLEVRSIRGDPADHSTLCL